MGLFSRRKAGPAPDIEEPRAEPARELTLAPPTGAGATQDMVAKAAGELLAGTVMSRIQADVALIAKRLDEQNGNMHALNLALGDFREKLVVPLKAELAHLRYGMGPKVEQTTTELAMFVTHLDKVLGGILEAQGWSKERVAQYRSDTGLDSVDAPRAAEFNAYAETIESNRILAEQNQRLLARLQELEKPKKKARTRPKAVRRG